MLIQTGILTVPAPDEAAHQAVATLVRRVAPGAVVRHEKSTGSQRLVIEELLRRWCDVEELDLIITIGGTFPAPGPAAQEIVPEATLAVVERLLPGLPEEMCAAAREASTLALLDRGVAGIRGRTLILNLPAGVGPATSFLAAVVDLIESILAHLQERPDAPCLADHWGGQLHSTSATQQEEKSANESTASALTSSLDPAEFAAFLMRKK
jgi:molybdopterin adenylyltransferase